MIKDIRAIIQRSLRNRVDFRVPTGSRMDSSAISYLANGLYKEKFGGNARLKTFAIGVGKSSDIQNARITAQHIDSDHIELIVDLDQVLEVLPEVIYYLESFDPSLVRSSISNFLISKYAKEHGYEVLLSGEGGDEIFCASRAVCPADGVHWIFAQQCFSKAGPHEPVPFHAGSSSTNIWRAFSVRTGHPPRI